MKTSRERKTGRRSIPLPSGVSLLIAIGLTGLYVVLAWGWGLDRGLALTVRAQALRGRSCRACRLPALI